MLQALQLKIYHCVSLLNLMLVLNLPFALLTALLFQCMYIYIRFLTREFNWNCNQISCIISTIIFCLDSLKQQKVQYRHFGLCLQCKHGILIFFCDIVLFNFAVNSRLISNSIHCCFRVSKIWFFDKKISNPISPA